ncbi:hypothetical protein AB4Y42_38965 [Paraburkholderia sp. EG286B]|uniref:hypothetical protein n=1 Tax=Paraburkholderia sp. EG286B TaxID=3237011 RepID=UPI0034D22248
MEQLDIFADSRDVMLRNDVVDALLRRDAGAARAAWTRLGAQYPGDGTLLASGTLVLVLALEADCRWPFADHAELAVARRELSETIAAAAQRVLPLTCVQAWLAPCWRALAERAARLPFHAGATDDCAAPLWLCAGDWDKARQAAEQIPSWWRIPAPLEWAAEARYRLEGLDVAWPLLTELAWLAPARFVAMMGRLGDRVLDALRRQFDAEFAGTGDAADFAWFPAWLLTVKPGLADRLREARLSRHVDAERATSLLRQILSLERQGRQHDLVERRAALRGLHAGLYAAYMNTR